MCLVIYILREQVNTLPCYSMVNYHRITINTMCLSVWNINVLLIWRLSGSDIYHHLGCAMLNEILVEEAVAKTNVVDYMAVILGNCAGLGDTLFISIDCYCPETQYNHKDAQPCN